VAALVASVLAGCASRPPTAAAPATNLELMDRAVEGAVGGLTAALAADSTRSLRICVDEGHRQAGFLQDALLRACLDRGWRAAVCEEQSAAPPAAAWSLGVEVLELELRYSALGGLFGGGRTRRQAEAAFSATLADSTGAVHLLERYSALAEDEVSDRSLEALESGPFQPQRVGDRPPGLLEPAIAAAVALGMTYLLIGTHIE